MLAAVLTEIVWVEDWAFLRIASELYPLGALVLIGSPFRLRVPPACFAVALWFDLCRVTLWQP